MSHLVKQLRTGQKTGIRVVAMFIILINQVYRNVIQIFELVQTEILAFFDLTGVSK